MKKIMPTSRFPSGKNMGNYLLNLHRKFQKMQEKQRFFFEILLRQHHLAGGFMSTPVAGKSSERLDLPFPLLRSFY
jgi:hypothetical protein